ncbi:MAG: phenylacetate--CoA ligase family protein [Bacillota bacterium]|nr:phenylacetate--CoA ligase family protein [Bacillota bacterium]
MVVLNDNVLQKLNETLKQSRKSHFNKKRIPDKKIFSFEDFKMIPFTTKEDILKNAPDGFVCVPNKELYQYNERFRLTDEASVSWFTKSDLIDCARRINIGGIGFNENDRVLVRFPRSLSSTAHFTHIAAQMKNACVIPTSSENNITPFPRIVYLMKKLEITVLATLPAHAMFIAEAAQIMGYNIKSDFKALRAIYIAGEALTQSKRKLLEKIWDVPVFDNFGASEIGPLMIECIHRNTHPLEDSFLFEILDESLIREVEPGETGLLAVTTLTRRAAPLIRYLTGDRAKRVYNKCPCGRESSMEIQVRKKDSIIIENREFDLWILEEMVSHLPYNGMWVSEPYKDGIKFIIEKENDNVSMTSEMKKRLEENYRVSIYIELVEKGSLKNRQKLINPVTLNSKNLNDGGEQPFCANHVSCSELFNEKFLWRNNLLLKGWKI